MFDVGSLGRLLLTLRAVPLWVFVALSLAGYAAIFFPSFGGVDLRMFRMQWGVSCWLAAVTSTIFAVVFSIDQAVKYFNNKLQKLAKCKKSLRVRRYREVYIPLLEQFNDIYITTSSATMAPDFQRRVRNAWRSFHNRKGTFVAVKLAWANLFDRKTTEETGEVSFGGGFPIYDLKRVAYNNIAVSDQFLLDLVDEALKERFENQMSICCVSEKDIKLYRWIVEEHRRLKKSTYF